MPDLVNLFFIVIISIAIFLITGRWVNRISLIISNLDYLCTNCGGYIYLEPWQAVSTLHFFGRRWVRCPHCHQMTWAQPIRK